MAFCNSCGNSMEAGAKFCPKCGAAARAGAAIPAAAAASGAPAPPIQAQSSGALKIVLIVVAVIVVMGVLGMGATALFFHHMFSHSHISQNNGDVRVETPFGTVESTNDPGQAARDLGVDIYPGATVVKGGAANMQIGGMHTAAGEFETSDPASTVYAFYKAKFPGAGVVTSQDGHYSLMSGTQGNLVTINIDARDGMTRIHIAKVTGKMMGGASSN